MDAVEKMLDEIEANIQLVSSELVYRENLIEELQALRQEFESKTQRDFLLEAKIREFYIRSWEYITGTIDNPLPQKEITVPKIELEGDISGNGESLFQNAKEQIDIKILRAKLLEAKQETNVDAIREFVNFIEDRYNELQRYSRDLEQDIVAVKYEIMLGYLQDNRLEEAKEYSKSFSTDMRIYIVDKLKDRLVPLIDEGKLDEASKLTSYIYDDKMQENDINLWFLIAKIELKDFVEPTQQQTTNLPVVQEKKSFFTKVKEKIEQSKKDKEEAKKNNIKIFRISFDPKNAETGMNKRDFEKIKRYIQSNANRANPDKFRIILENGITKIPSYAFASSSLVDINFPYSLERIGDGAFEKTGLKKVDLTKTKVTVIPKKCFENCKKLEEIQLPEKLTYIGEASFKNSGLRKINLEETEITEIENEAFAECQEIDEFKLPNTLVTMKNTALRGTRINKFDMRAMNPRVFRDEWLSNLKGEYVSLPAIEACTEIPKFRNIDFTQTKIKSIPASFFENCTAIENMVFPTCLENIGGRAFENSSIQNVDLSKTMVKIIPRDCFGNCKKLKRILFPDTIVEIGKRAFDNSGIEEANFQDTKQKITFGEHAFRNCKRLKNIFMPKEKADQERSLREKYIKETTKEKAIQEDGEKE
nr:leucine-rich repeat domain-containing protein [Clostridia bacterium]